MTPIADDFTTTEAFPCTVPIGAWVRRFLPSFLAMSLAMLILFELLVHLVVAGAISWVVALIPTVLIAIVLWLGKKRQFDETWKTATLNLSPTGAVVVERHCRTELPWEQIHALGKADLINRGAAPRVILYNPAGVIAWLLSKATIATTVRRGQDALIGRGSLTVNRGTSTFVRGQIARNQGARDVDPKTGRRLTAIVLPAYDRHWRTGRIGQWIAAYRPDLLTDR